MGINILHGIQKFLYFVNDNWTTIVVVIGLSLAVTKKACAYFSKSKEEKIAIAKKIIQEIMLKLVMDAEYDYSEWVKAGSIKRSQVINEIFIKFPVLSNITNQEEIINWLDEVINNALEEMRKILEENKVSENTESSVEIIE